MSEVSETKAAAPGGLNLTTQGKIVAGLGALLLLGALLFGGISFGGGSQVDVEEVDQSAAYESVAIPAGKYTLSGEVVARPSNNTFVLAVTGAAGPSKGPWSFAGEQGGGAEDFVGRLIVVQYNTHTVLDKKNIGRFYNDDHWFSSDISESTRIYTFLTVTGDWSGDGAALGVLSAAPSFSSHFDAFSQGPAMLGGQQKSLTP